MSEVPFDPSPLLCCAPFQRLLALEKEVSPFEILGIQSNELTHSRVLGSLLCAEGPFALASTLMPRLAAALRCARTGSAPDATTIIKLAAARFRAGLEHQCNWSDGSAAPVLGRIDLLLEDEEQKLVVAIENKIWAGEQHKQVDRYRQWLASERVGWTSLVVFLTPNGSAPQSFDPTRLELPPCYRLGWGDIAQGLEDMVDKDASGTVRAFVQNIRRHIMGDTEEKRLVSEIMANPQLAQVMRKIIAHMPKFADIQDRIIEGVKRITDSEVLVEFYPPSRGDTKQIKIRLKKWSDAGAPICFNFYDGQRPAVRTMMHVNDWKKCSATMMALADLDGSAIDKKCPVRREWSEWRLVLADDEDTDAAWERTTIIDHSYSEASANGLLDIFRGQYATLKPTMEAFLQNPARFKGNIANA